MQTDIVSTRILAASHKTHPVQVHLAGQVVIDDWRLGDWVTDAGAPAWATPTTVYSLNGTASGDYVKKSTASWDMQYQDLAQHTPVLLPDGVTTDTPYISSVAMSGTQDLICFYANRLRNGWDSGIYVMRCVDDGAGHLYWSQPTCVYASVAVAEWNQASQMFVTFPRLQVINGEYWIIALECGKEINVLTYHLCYFRSSDGEHWSRKEYLAGVSSDADEAIVGINQHNGGTAFTLNDLKHAYLTVSGSKVYMVSKTGSKFSCAATSLVGVTNSSKVLDVTKQAQSYSFSRPTAPGSLQTRTTIQNVAKMFDGNSILIPGARLIRKNGWVTTNGAEMCTIGYEWIDSIDGKKEMQPGSYRDTLDVIAGDSMLRLRDLSEDTTYEYNSPKQSVYDSFCDLTAILPINGSRFYIGLDGVTTDLTCVPQDPNAVSYETAAYLQQPIVSDGSMEFRFSFEGNVNVANTAAIMFQGDKAQGERQFYSIAYWVILGKWVIVPAVPTTAGHKIYSYDINIVYVGASQSLSPDTWYWLKVTQYHDHVLAEVSTEATPVHWTTVIDYSVHAPTVKSIPANQGYWGLLGHSVSSPSGAIGNTDATGGKVAMDSGGSPKMWAVQITTPASKGILYALAGLFTQTGQPADLTVGIVADSGGSPANVTVEENVIYSVSVKSLNYGATDAPAWKYQPVPSNVRLAASSLYWLYVTFNGALGGGQSWEWYTDTGGSHGTTKSSTDGGGTWSTESGKSLAACIFIDSDGGLTQFRSMNWTSGEAVHTLEDLAHHISARAHVLNITPDAFGVTADLVAGWLPSAFGTLGDFVMDCDVSGANAEVYFRATTQGNAATGYKVVIGSTMKVYWQNVLVSQLSSMQYIPSAYHLRVVCQTNFVYVWINEALALTYYAPAANVPGYFGVGVATFTNLRIPHLNQIVPYWLTDEGETALTALGKLFDPAKTGYKYFMRFDNSLRIVSLPASRRVSVDTYSDTIQATETGQTNRYAIGQIKPTSNHTALRFFAEALARVGLRVFKKFDYVRGFSNEQAYADGLTVANLAEEQNNATTMNSDIAVYPGEIEDRITNSITGKDYLVNDISWDYELNGTAKQKLGLREIP
jgi:hypothetical protein